MRRSRIAALSITIVALLGSCATDQDAAEPDTTAEETAPSTPGSEEITAATVQVADNDEHGEILVDAGGMTLYVFLRDEPGTSNCKDACAQTWPPLTADGEPTAGEGLDADKVSTIEREDGSMQVTYDRPLYRYSGDGKAGDTKGQGIGGNWYVLGPDAEPIKGT